MVNEINKPPTSDHLNERLAASNRQLREMQEEHRQLLQEMEALRERATELNRLSFQRQQIQLQQQQQIEKTTHTESVTTATMSSNEESSTINAVEENREASPSPAPIETSTATTNNQAESKTTEDDDAESADYIKQKIAEIAALKTQYKRVEHMVNTTNLIEQHLSSKSLLDCANTTTTATEQRTQQNIATSSSSASSSSATTATATTAPVNSSTVPQDSKEELLTAMLSMFNNFSDDLRGQAESLRAERERIRDLKELLIQRRKGGDS